jgi:hypothetical protein
MGDPQEAIVSTDKRSSHTVRFENLSLEQAISALTEISKKEGSLSQLGKAIHGTRVPPFSIDILMDEPVGASFERPEPVK